MRIKSTKFRNRFQSDIITDHGLFNRYFQIQRFKFDDDDNNNNNVYKRQYVSVSEIGRVINTQLVSI